MLGPRIDSVTPDRGPEAGGTTVTISGTNLGDIVAVTFDGVAAASFALVDASTITAVTPFLGYTGASEVVVTNSVGITSDIYPVDSSGNGFDGSYVEAGAYPQFVSGLVSGNDALLLADPTSPANAAGLDAPPVFDFNSDVSVEFWLTVAQDHASGTSDNFIDFQPDGRIVVSSLGHLNFARGAFAFDGQVYSFDASAYTTDGLKHHYLFNATIGACRAWVDGNEIIGTPDVSDSFSGSFTPPLSRIVVNPDTFAAGTNGTLDELAFYQGLLDGTNAAAHIAAAASSIADYQAAVFADSPAAYYWFDDDRGNGLFRYLSPEGWHVGAIAMGGT